MYATSAASELRWRLAENLHALIAREESDKDDAATSQVNAWLARMHWRGPDSVLEAVKQWHTDDLARRFAVARTILLQEYDPAIAMLPELLASGEITRENLLTWPLFEPRRLRPVRRHEQPDHTESTALPAIQNRATNSTDSRYQDRSFASKLGYQRRLGRGQAPVTGRPPVLRAPPVETVAGHAVPEHVLPGPPDPAEPDCAPAGLPRSRHRPMPVNPRSGPGFDQRLLEI